MAVSPSPRVRSLPHARESRKGVYLLPNLLTSAGLFCGVYSIVQTMQGEYLFAALAILVAQLFDILDGRVARYTNTASRFGVEYDSLCDLVSFGVASGLLIYGWALKPWGVWGWLAIGLFVICAALRLARFNTMVDKVDGSFSGLPVPAAAMMLASVVLMYKYLGRSGLPDKHIALLLMTYTLAALMVSTLPFASFKQLRLNRRQPLWRLVLAILMLKFLIARYELVIFLFISAYVCSGPITWALKRYRGEPIAVLTVEEEDEEDLEA
ncbi:MAG: CDP-diacylglycerol--serine O-phosphatidyltransferase [Candidatus Binatia bacterium]